MIYELNDPSKAAPLYADRKDADAGITTCLDNVMGKIVAAASSCTRSGKGTDIGTDVVREERHRGPGSAVAAKLIPECLDEGLYPVWDAANRMPIRPAEKPGYEFNSEYVVYGVE